jgi:hypothetical protein
MSQDWASVIPFEDWSPGFANVMPMPPGPTDMPTVIPLMDTQNTNFPVERNQYPMGLVVLVKDDPPAGPPADLPLVWVDDDFHNAEIGQGSNNPNGVVILFRGK